MREQVIQVVEQYIDAVRHDDASTEAHSASVAGCRVSISASPRVPTVIVPTALKSSQKCGGGKRWQFPHRCGRLDQGARRRPWLSAPEPDLR